MSHAAKARFRQELRQRARPCGDRAWAASLAAVGHLLRSAELFRARRVAIFASLPDEIPTRPFHDALLHCGRTPMLPRAGKGRTLEFAPVLRWDALRPGVHGILEPAPASPAVQLETPDLVLVPGLGFDGHGGRLGRGGGYYDHTFAVGCAGPMLVGLGFAAQRVARVPTEVHDRGMDGLLTELGLVRVPRSENGG